MPMRKQEVIRFHHAHIHYDTAYGNSRCIILRGPARPLTNRGWQLKTLMSLSSGVAFSCQLRLHSAALNMGSPTLPETSYSSAASALETVIAWKWKSHNRRAKSALGVWSAWDHGKNNLGYGNRMSGIITSVVVLLWVFLHPHNLT